MTHEPDATQPQTPQWYHTPTATMPRPTTDDSLPSGPSAVGAPDAGTGRGDLGAPAPRDSGASSTSRGGGRRVVELAAVATLAAVLASGGTVAALNLTDSSAAATSSSQTTDAAATTPGLVVQADASAPNWTVTAGAVSSSVVAITATTPQGVGQGSGVIIDTAGHILTNNHVVAGATELTVTLSDGRTLPATIQGTDPSTDLAVVTLTKAPTGLSPLAIGDSDALAVGDPVMAVGNPLGLAGTVTTGIVSALDRPVSTQQEGGATGGGAERVVTNAIQTSAAINPGNSGGALVNGEGQLVGINSSIATLGTNGQSGSIGIGFAIPVNEAMTIAEQLIATGSAEHAYLGVGTRDGSATDGSATRAGALIVSVADQTPAAQAGLQGGDVVIAIDGQAVDSADSLIGHVRESAVGDSVTLTVLRDGQKLDLTATLTVKSPSA